MEAKMKSRYEEMIESMKEYFEAYNNCPQRRGV